MTYIRMEDYEINSHTMALLAKENEDGQVYTEVLELGDRFDMTKCPSDIVDDSCRYFASSLEGRLAGTKQVTNYTHKPPIVVSEAMSIYFFLLFPQNARIAPGLPTNTSSPTFLNPTIRLRSILQMENP